MLFRPGLDETAKAAGERLSGTRAASGRRRPLWIAITLLIVGGLAYLGWTAFSQKKRDASWERPDRAVPVLAATARIQDVPVYLDGVGAVRALSTVTVRSQVNGKLIAVNFTEGQDVKKGDVLGEIEPVIYQAQYDQAVAKKAQDEAQLANMRLDLKRYEQLAASSAGSKQQADTQRAVVAQQEALVKADQAAIDNAQAMLGFTKIVAPISGRVGLRQVDRGNIINTADATGLVIITQLQPISVQFSLPQQQITRVNAAAAKGEIEVDVFGNDGTTVIDTGKLIGIDNQVDPTTGTLRLRAAFSNEHFQLWLGQFVNVRIKVETLSQATVIPTAAVQRGPLGTFSYVIDDDDIVTAKPVKVRQQDEKDAVIAKGVAPADRVVTTGFANLSDGAKVKVGESDQAPTADLAPQARQDRRGARRGGDGNGSERRGRRSERGQNQSGGGAQENGQSGGGPKPRP